MKHLGSLEDTQEARVALGYAPCASFVLSKLPASYLDERTLTYEPIVKYEEIQASWYLFTPSDVTSGRLGDLTKAKPAPSCWAQRQRSLLPVQFKTIIQLVTADFLKNERDGALEWNVSWADMTFFIERFYRFL